MASITLINGVTKQATSSEIRYYFSGASVLVDTSTGKIAIDSMGFGMRHINYADLTEAYGTATAEEYVDYLAANNFFFNIVQTATAGIPYIIAVERGLIPGEEVVDKFGYNPDIDSGSAPETVWNGGGLYTGFPMTAPEQLEIFSSSANDTAGGTGARTVLISNLQREGIRQPDVTITLDGTTPVSLGAETYDRCTRMRVLEVGTSGYNEGEITLRHATTTENVFAVMPSESGATQIAAYTVPAGYELEILDVNVSLIRENGATGSARVALRQRQYDAGTGAWLSWQDTPRTAISTGFNYQKVPKYPLPIPARTDIEIVVEGVSDNNSSCSAELFGILREVTT